jgi:flagellar basal-body rod modification protein FlgD
MNAAPVVPTNSHQLKSSSPKSNTALKTEDFINMMVTQLQNQDPTDPVKNQDLLAQMSQIGQLQSTTDLQTSLKNLVLQNSLGAAGNLIGKMVQGLDEQGAALNGLVTSVRVEDGNVQLELDNGKALALDHVTGISSAPVGTSAK